MKRFLLPFFALVCALPLAACDPTPTADTKMRQQQERLSNEANSQVGMPAIVNFQEKRMAKMIIELRDTALSTVTYITSFEGKLIKVCDSVGYGLPYATQFTSPQKPAYIGGSGITALPQADPNGLFSPASADGTWVMCLNPDTKKTVPVYVEQHVMVSPFPLHLTPQ